MTALALAGTALRRIAHDRTSLFFLVALPVVIIVLLGVSVTDQESFRVGVVDGGSGTHGVALTRALELDDAMAVHRFGGDDAEDRARTALRRGELDSVVVVPEDADATAAAGGVVEVAVLGEQTNATHRAAGQAVSAVVAEQAAVVTAARARSSVAEGTPRDHLAAARAAAARTPPVAVRTTVVDAESGILPGGFAYSTPTMLVLFVFITSVAGSAQMIESRRLGIHERMLAGPVTPWAIVAGETLSHLTVALLQSLLIVGVGVLVFGVDWGDPLAATALVLLWALVGTGAGVLAGSLFRTPEQATAIGVSAGMAAGMLGGCMWPLEIVGDTMRTVGHAVPHAWAVDAWVELLSRGGGLADIAGQLAVLGGFALVLLTAATLRLRARLTA